MNLIFIVLVLDNGIGFEQKRNIRHQKETFVIIISSNMSTITSSSDSISLLRGLAVRMPKRGVAVTAMVVVVCSGVSGRLIIIILSIFFIVWLPLLKCAH